MKIKQSYVDIKRKNMPGATDLAEVYALITRVTNATYAAAIVLELCEEDGFDCYEISDRDGKILLRASSGVALAAALRAQSAIQHTHGQ